MVVVVVLVEVVDEVVVELDLVAVVGMWGEVLDKMRTSFKSGIKLTLLSISSISLAIPFTGPYCYF